MPNTVPVRMGLLLFKLAPYVYQLCKSNVKTALGEVDLEDNSMDSLMLQNVTSEESKMGYSGKLFLNFTSNAGKLGEYTRSFLTRTQLSEVCIQDLNNDQYPDLVADSAFVLASQEGDFGVGEKGFRPVVDFFSSFAHADLNGDGFPDLVLAKGKNLSVHFGDVAGRFGPANDYLAPEVVRSVGVVDFDGDGKLDVILGLGKKKFNILFNKGSSALSSAAKASELTEINTPSTTLLLVAGVVAFIVVAALAYDLYRKSQQHKSMKSEDGSKTDLSYATSLYGIYPSSNAAKRSASIENAEDFSEAPYNSITFN